MSKTTRGRSRLTVADVCKALEEIAPAALAQPWDNVGLLAGDPSAAVRRVLLCIDLTPGVVDEAIERKSDFVLAYHPPIFKPISTLRANSDGTDASVFRCVRNGIAIYSSHTALDAADGGTNDVIASLCGCRSTEPLVFVEEPGIAEFKLVVFVPQKETDHVAGAMFDAGAGHIGEYSRCSYRLAGQGTFHGGDSTQPSIGTRGRLEKVDEIRLETVVGNSVLPAVVDALLKAHSYDEPAFDIYPLKPRPARGIGRIGALAKPTTLGQLARKLKRATSADCVQTVGSADRAVERVVIVVGAAGSLPFHTPLTPHDCIVTGEIRHHDALTIDRRGSTAIALGHWASERPVLSPLAEQLKAKIPGSDIETSSMDRDPFQPI